MFASSRQIVNEVDNTTYLDQALSLVVKRSRSSMGADACSVYIYDTQTDRFILMAFDGVMSDEVGKAPVSPNEGLVGWVAAHEEVINLSNAADHPGFDHVSKTANESFHGFLGAPLCIMAGQWVCWWRRSMSDEALAMTMRHFLRHWPSSLAGLFITFWRNGISAGG